MERKKLNLSELEINSFVTEIESSKIKTIKGAAMSIDTTDISAPPKTVPGWECLWDLGTIPINILQSIIQSIDGWNPKDNVASQGRQGCTRMGCRTNEGVSNCVQPNKKSSNIYEA